MNRLLRACGNPVVEHLLGIDGALSAAVRAERRASGQPLSFFSTETRIRIGQRLVRRLHSSGRDGQVVAARANAHRSATAAR
jgi:hypothetical protein